MKAAEAGHDVAGADGAGGAGGGRGGAAPLAGRPVRSARSAAAGANGGDGRIALEVLRAAGREAAEGADGDVLIDALFGTGFHGEPRPEAAAQIDSLNASGRPVIAVDLPSGVNADTGEIAGAAVRADVTVTMHARKVGLEVAPGRFHAGEVVVADIGLEPRETATQLVTHEILGLVPRKRGARQQVHARARCWSSAARRGWAAPSTLTATAAFRADAGYVHRLLGRVEPQLLEAVKRPLADALEASDEARCARDRPRARTRRRSPGARPSAARGDRPAGRGRRRRRSTGWSRSSASAPTVLTPHSGELGRLLGRESAEVDAHRLEAVRAAAARFGCVCLLKGADTLVAAPGEGALVCRLTHPSLATAGTGDVLTGVIGAFLAKGVDPRFAAAAAALACDRAAGLAPRRGLVASDVAALLPRALD